jgi:hypothetical protein
MGYKDITDKRFGKLVAIRHTGFRGNERRYPIWECLCDCGKTLHVLKPKLLGNKVKDCGCSTKTYGVGNYRSNCEYARKVDTVNSKEYQVWASMLSRCYCKDNLKRRPNYLEVEVSDNFKDFNYFSEWCNNQKGFGLAGYQLDKDILSRGTGKLIYSEDTCCFIPNKLNMHFLVEGKEGVNLNKGSWQANISISGKTKYIGCSSDKEEAIRKYKEYKKSVVMEIIDEYKDTLDDKVVCKIKELLEV